jgi:hypothetical protein
MCKHEKKENGGVIFVQYKLATAAISDPTTVPDKPLSPLFASNPKLPILVFVGELKLLESFLVIVSPTIAYAFTNVLEAVDAAFDIAYPPAASQV